MPNADNEMKALIAHKNGAVSLYDLKRRSFEFQTEAGHSETIFDA
jgi:hypothetical protein